MFRWLESRILWGTLLILTGVVFLLQNLFNFELSGYFWGILLGLVGLFFISVFMSRRAAWWALIPGFALLGVSATILVSTVFPRIGEIFGGVFVLGGIGVAFVAVYLFDQRNWWAVIPAGVMLTLSAIVLLDQMLGGFGSGGVLFLGFGLTFAVVALLPTPHGKMNWAWYPAGILFVMGILISAAAENLFGYIWPIALILAGLILVYRAYLSR
jgi:hypothetical protein